MTGQQKIERINVGIFAHVDAGKTTTTEHILYESGRIRSLGSVDSGTALTDSMEVERQRGISVRAALASFAWKGVQVNLVDTPGHVDFLSEVERSLRVMDCAVIILLAVEGVQAQSEMIWSAAQAEDSHPCFMNKLDRIGADPDAVLAQALTYLSRDIIPVQQPVGKEQDYIGTTDLWENDADSGAQTECWRLWPSGMKGNRDTVMNYSQDIQGKSLEPPVLQGDRMIIEGRLPLATSLDYPVTLSSFTKGRSTFTSFFAGYEECPPDVAAERTRRGVNPLDQAKYILSVRKALQG